MAIRNRGDRGFTLVELMIVIGIIGILAAIAVPNFLLLKQKAVWGTTKGNAEVIRAGLANYAANADDNRYPAISANSYNALRASLPNSSLPADPADAKIAALNYTPNANRDDYVLVLTSTNMYADTVRATPSGVLPAEYPDH